MANKKKNPNRVKGGHKAWLKRLAKERAKDIAKAFYSEVPGYGVVDHLGAAFQTEKKIHDIKTRNNTTRRRRTKRKYK